MRVKINHFDNIDGFDGEVKDISVHLSGITVIDPVTISIGLFNVDTTFLHVMAINFSLAVPKEEVVKYKLDFGKHPVF